MGHASVVRAAGCILWRRSASHDGIELAVIYRPRWADWSWPKGKLKRGETFPAAARREVLEETGHTCRLGTELPGSHYIDAQDRPKEVRYWAAESTGGSFQANKEVSRLVWLPPEEARAQLTYERDRAMVGAALLAIRANARGS